MKTIFLLILMGFIYLYADNLKIVEKKYLSLNVNIKTHQNTVDSLTDLLNKKVSFIEQEKKRKKNVNDLLTEAFSLTEAISAEQNVIKKINIEMKNHANKLDSMYTIKIESLQLKVKLTQNFNEKREIDKKIYLLTGKRFLLTPMFYALSFKPDKIENINLDAAKDDFETIVFREYLQNADIELGKHLKEIKKTKQDLERISGLKKKTNEFLEDIQDDGSWAVINEGAKENAVFEGTNEHDYGARDSKQLSVSTQFMNNYLNYQNLWIQLNDEKNNKYPIPMDDKDSLLSEINMDDYLELMDKLEIKLEKYLDEIQAKLK